MNFRVLLLLVVPMIVFWTMPGMVQAQHSFQDAPSRDQWVSHQMNQPPPDMSDKQLSQDRLDELRQLYELARREAEAKAGKKADTKK